MRLPRSIAGWTMAVFGILAIIMGATGLLRPDAMLTGLGFEVVPDAERAAGDYTRVFIMASSMASFNMGIYYLVSVYTEWRAFYLFTVVFRLLTFTVFTLLVVSGEAPERFFGVAAWEGIGALATGIGLWLDRRHRVFSNP
ncbi:hypothetical protein [Catenuloplanes atrovinosus]|uniref:Uncharacterized protein n=1 Tax=Catenuloplanes atrovinosus TaxID=137266 RepID=A0AAE3YXX5_9ACTN|nr:hypothetical protein [Catenuloplanes atrovinosus]MDR7280254.1 hypothetical protein [Catenuloplanes atrovinosus]